VDQPVFYVFDNADKLISYLAKFLLIPCLTNYFIHVIVT